MNASFLPSPLMALVQACQEPTSPTRAVPTSQPETAELVSTAAVKHLWAVVGLGGNLIRGSRVTGVAHLGVGQYEVTFNRSVSGCAYIATTNNAYSQALGIFTASGHSSANGVYVETKNQGGGLTDGPFNLVVACGPLNTRFAVVGYSANLVRATSGTTLSALGSGRYNVTFQGSVSGCAYLATVGDPGNALVFNPSGVYTGKGPNSKTVYIETKNPGGGLQDGVPFHLAIICPGTADGRFAVVKAGGPKQRASTGTTSSRSSTGEYTVTSNRNVSTCAAIATRGSVNTAVPFSPATVEIVPRPSTSSIGIEVRELLFFGGNLANQAFHARWSASLRGIGFARNGSGSDCSGRTGGPRSLWRGNLDAVLARHLPARSRSSPCLAAPLVVGKRLTLPGSGPLPATAHDRRRPGYPNRHLAPGGPGPGPRRWSRPAGARGRTVAYHGTDRSDSSHIDLRFVRCTFDVDASAGDRDEVSRGVRMHYRRRARIRDAQKEGPAEHQAMKLAVMGMKRSAVAGREGHPLREEPRLVAPAGERRHARTSVNSQTCFCVGAVGRCGCARRVAAAGGDDQESRQEHGAAHSTDLRLVVKGLTGAEVAKIMAGSLLARRREHRCRGRARQWRQSCRARGVCTPLDLAITSRHEIPRRPKLPERLVRGRRSPDPRGLRPE